MDIDDNKLIVTLAVVMHGSVFTLDLSDETTNIFQNVRLLCGSGGFLTYETDFINALVLNKRLRTYFARDIDNASSTFSMLGESKSSMLIGNVTFDKVFSTSTSDSNMMAYFSFNTYFEGIFLISVHKGKKLIYPSEQNEFLNLLLIKDLIKISQIFNTQVPILNDFSSNFPNIEKYLNEENSIKKSKLSENQKSIKLEEIKNRLTNILNNWNLTLDSSGKKIEIIKMSALVELIKILISENCIINLLDYSCNSLSKFVPEEQKPNLKYTMKYDIEQGLPNTKLGGKKYHRHKKTKKHGKLKKTRKNKKIFKKIFKSLK